MITQAIQDFAKCKGVTVGICDPSPLDPKYLQSSTFTPFVSTDINKRTNPAAILPSVKSIIVLGAGQEKSPQSLIDAESNTAELSTIGTTNDYHINIKTLLQELITIIDHHSAAVDNTYKILVDSPTLDERAFAKRAGIGFFGRNGLIVSPQFGTRFNIGLLLTNIEIPATPSTTKNKKCPPQCRHCINACPGNALTADKPLNVNKCVSYLTQKAELSPEEKKLLGNQLYGCDICQDVCPLNTPRKKTYVNPNEWLSLDDTTLKEKYAHTAMLWKGTSILRRNAQAVTDNVRTHLLQ